MAKTREKTAAKKITLKPVKRPGGGSALVKADRSKSGAGTMRSGARMSGSVGSERLRSGAPKDTFRRSAAKGGSSREVSAREVSSREAAKRSEGRRRGEGGRRGLSRVGLRDGRSSSVNGRSGARGGSVGEGTGAADSSQIKTAGASARASVKGPAAEDLRRSATVFELGRGGAEHLSPRGANRTQLGGGTPRRNVLGRGLSALMSPSPVRVEVSGNTQRFVEEFGQLHDRSPAAVADAETEGAEPEGAETETDGAETDGVEGSWVAAVQSGMSRSSLSYSAEDLSNQSGAFDGSQSASADLVENIEKGEILASEHLPAGQLTGEQHSAIPTSWPPHSSMREVVGKESGWLQTPEEASSKESAEAVPEIGLQFVELDQLAPSEVQPRKSFSEEEIAGLAQSIQESGLIQPILVRRREVPFAGFPQFEIIAGERRYRAARRAGLERVPVIVRDLDDHQALQVAIVENIQRADLNPIEEAQAYQRLIDQFGETQSSVATAVGKDRVSVANALRLLKLPESIRALLAAGQLTAGHGRALLMVEGEEAQEQLAQQILAGEGLSVRQVEQLAGERAASTSGKGKRRGGRQAERSAALAAVEDRLRQALGTKVTVTGNSTGGGEIRISFFSKEELENVLDHFRA